MYKSIIFGILFLVSASLTACEQQILKPFNPTGNPDTPVPPQSVPTLVPVVPADTALSPEPLPPPYEIEFEYKVVEPGNRIPFRALGFNYNEALNVKITRPDGTIVEYPANADGYGVLKGTISVESDRPTGMYTVEIVGQSSGYAADGVFTISAPRRTITGKIVNKDDKEKEIRVVAESGQTETLKVTQNTTDENGDPLDFDDLNESDQVKVEYNPRTDEALKVEKLN